jgi:hypothetical protein
MTKPIPCKHLKSAFKAKGSAADVASSAAARLPDKGQVRGNECVSRLARQVTSQSSGMVSVDVWVERAAHLTDGLLGRLEP